MWYTNQPIMVKRENRKLLIITPDIHRLLKIKSAETGIKVQDIADRILRQNLA